MEKQENSILRMSLLTSTGITDTDPLLSQVIAHFEANFPHRICGFYLEGSYADGTAMSTSDLDLRVVFKETFTSEERDRFAELRAKCNATSSVRLDLNADSLQSSNWDS